MAGLRLVILLYHILPELSSAICGDLGQSHLDYLPHMGALQVIFPYPDPTKREFSRSFFCLSLSLSHFWASFIAYAIALLESGVSFKSVGEGS
jgi:hypothetical protein